jgi:hypothetical protein
MCLPPPTTRTGVHSSAGNSGVVDGSVIYACAFNTYVASGVDPALTNGATVWTQFWSRDSASSVGTNLTDALLFALAGPWRFTLRSNACARRVRATRGRGG